MRNEGRLGVRMSRGVGAGDLAVIGSYNLNNR